MKRLRALAVAAVAAISLAAIPATQADATLVGCSITPLYSGNLRTGSRSICTQTYGAAGQQRVRIRCYDGNGAFYYDYGFWVNVNVNSSESCNAGHVATSTIIEHRAI